LNCRTYPKITCIASAELRGHGAAGTAIAFCSDDERPYLRDIEKLTRCSLRVIPLAIPAPRNDPIERPAKVRSPQPATTDVRRRDPPAGGSFPEFLRRASSTKRGSVGRRGQHRSRMQTRGSPTIGLRIGSD
jgi:ATP-dependent RNA helicase RhlE